MNGWHHIETCCDLIAGVFDGKYGWMTEAASIVALVILFNLFSKWVLKRLHHRFERQNQIWKDAFVRALHKPLSAYVWFFAVVQAVSVVNFRIYTTCSFGSEEQLLDLGLIACITWFLMRWKHNCVEYMLLRIKNHQLHVERKKIDIYDKLLTMTVLLFTLIAILDVTGSSMATIIAFGGVGGLALAFASQEIIASFFGGLMIYITQPFAIGDWIQLPEKDMEGIVEEIGWYMTRLRTLEKRPVYIPNSLFSKMVVTTPSKMSHRRFMEKVRVRYEDLPKIPAATEEIQEMLEDHPDIDPEQIIAVNLVDLGDYFVDLLVHCYSFTTEAKDFYAFKQEIILKVLEILRKHQIPVAYPVYLYVDSSTKNDTK